ncbi:MAG: DUF3822 family protein [Bacteroidales bacterium]|jgi:hypothetical protein|nr:DUF3822 family protein [Bacteroidales bacterium]
MPEIGNKIAKADVNLIDETFDISQAESYHLSVQNGPDGLSFCVFNTVINKCIVLRNYPISADPSALLSECSVIFECDDLLGLRYKTSSYLWISPRCTLVPDHLFDQGEADACLEFNHGAMAGEQTMQNYIRSVGLYNIFSCPEALAALFRLYQHNINFFHQAMPFIESVVAGMSPSVRGMAVYFYSHYLDIAVVENRKLLFYNTFPINAPEDSVYYLAGVSNLFDIDLLSTKLMYAGNFRHMPPEVAILKNHVDRIIECEPSKAVTYSHYIIEPFRKDFINLFNLYGCES